MPERVYSAPDPEHASISADFPLNLEQLGFKVPSTDAPINSVSDVIDRLSLAGIGAACR